MTMQKLTENVFFLYDYSILKFLNNFRNVNDPINYFTSLDKAFLPFFYYFDSMAKEQYETFVGCHLIKEDKKFKLFIITQEGSASEFRVPWVQRLGFQISKFNDFSKGPFFIYSTLNYNRELTTSKEK